MESVSIIFERRISHSSLRICLKLSQNLKVTTMRRNYSFDKVSDILSFFQSWNSNDLRSCQVLRTLHKGQFLRSMSKLSQGLLDASRTAQVTDISRTRAEFRSSKRRRFQIECLKRICIGNETEGLRNYHMKILRMEISQVVLLLFKQHEVWSLQSCKPREAFF